MPDLSYARFILSAITASRPLFPATKCLREKELAYFDMYAYVRKIQLYRRENAQLTNATSPRVNLSLINIAALGRVRRQKAPAARLRDDAPKELIMAAGISVSLSLRTLPIARNAIQPTLDPFLSQGTARLTTLFVVQPRPIIMRGACVRPSFTLDPPAPFIIPLSRFALSSSSFTIPRLHFIILFLSS